MAAIGPSPLSRMPLVLRPNPVRYLIAGGPLLRRFLGEAADPEDPDPPSQMWVASTVASALGEGGLSRVSAADGGFPLKELLDSRPEEFLGPAHARKWGGNPGFLVKVLNSRDRLLVQVHPGDAMALRHFGSPFGKTEAWYVIEAEEGAVVHAGFKPGVTRDALGDAIAGGDSARILGLLHEFPVAAGDVLFIPAGLPHALGRGSLVAEIQQPTDITLRAERRRPSGEVLPESFLHAGRGMDVLLDCFDLEGRDREAARAGIFLRRGTLRAGSGFVEEALVPRDVTPCFAMNSVSVSAGAACRRRNDGFAVALAVSGDGFVSGNGWRLPVARGTELFIPNGVREYSWEAGSSLVILECLPPLGEGPLGEPA